MHCFRKQISGILFFSYLANSLSLIEEQLYCTHRNQTKMSLSSFKRDHTMRSLFLPELHLLVTQTSKLSSAHHGSVYFHQHLLSPTLSSTSTSLKWCYLQNVSISFCIFICCFLAALNLQFSGFILISLVLQY